MHARYRASLVYFGSIKVYNLRAIESLHCVLSLRMQTVDHCVTFSVASFLVGGMR